MSDVFEGSAVEVGTEVVPAPTQAPANLFGTTDPVEVISRATVVANALKDVIVKRGLFTKIQGKDHVTIDGWTLLGSMLGITGIVTATEVIDGGWKATVEARTFDGRVIGAADALCTKHEKRGPWKTADDYARLSMAQTRATSKALKGPLGFIVNLAGYASTPAEEMTFAEPDASSPPLPSAVWAREAAGRVMKLNLQEDLRTKLGEGMGESGNVVIPAAAKIGPVLGRLSVEQRDEIDGWLDTLEQTEAA